jgi:hypothetical protein
MTIRKIGIASPEFIGDYTKRLKQQGIQIIGQGMYSTVYQHPTYAGVVVKVFEPKFCVNYMKYVKACQKLKGNPWVPKLFGKPVLKTVLDRQKKEHQICFVFSEKLTASTSHDMSDLITALTDDESWVYQEYVNSYNWKPRSAAVTGKFVDPLWWEIIKWSCDFSRDEKVKLIRPLAELFSKARYLDIDQANIMMRGRQWVFTDPFPN